MENQRCERLTRKERERNRRRWDILNAAERVFVSKGFQAATVEEIAQEAEFSVGTLYNFFDGKADLYSSVVDKIIREFMTMMEEHVLCETEPDKAIGSLIQVRLTFSETHRWLFNAFLESSPESRMDLVRVLPESLFEVHDLYIEQVKSIFTAGIETGRFDHVDPLYLTLCLDGIINSFSSYWSRKDPQESLDQRVDKIKSLFLGWISGGCLGNG